MLQSTEKKVMDLLSKFTHEVKNISSKTGILMTVKENIFIEVFGEGTEKHPYLVYLYNKPQLEKAGNRMTLIRNIIGDCELEDLIKELINSSSEENSSIYTWNRILDYQELNSPFDLLSESTIELPDLQQVKDYLNK